MSGLNWFGWLGIGALAHEYGQAADEHRYRQDGTPLPRISHHSQWPKLIQRTGYRIGMLVQFGSFGLFCLGTMFGGEAADARNSGAFWDVLCDRSMFWGFMGCVIIAVVLARQSYKTYRVSRPVHPSAHAYEHVIRGELNVVAMLFSMAAGFFLSLLPLYPLHALFWKHHLQQRMARNGVDPCHVDEVVRQRQEADRHAYYQRQPWNDPRNDPMRNAPQTPDTTAPVPPQPNYAPGQAQQPWWQPSAPGERPWQTTSNGSAHRQ